MDEIFETTPDGVPFNIELEVWTKNGGISYVSWIGLWQKYFQEDYEHAFSCLVYIGSSVNFYAAIIIKKGWNLLKSIKRNVYTCYVIGSKGCGKTAFLEGIL